MSARAGLRVLRQPALRQQFQSSFKFAERRAQSTTAEAAEAAKNAAKEKVKETGFAAFMNSPVGPKTVHFWAPVMKWGLALAGAADFARPAEQLSLSQNAALMTTGLIWTRWCFVIKPRNIFLASVNFLLFLVGGTQCVRVLLYQQSVKNDSLSAKAERAVEDVKEAVVSK